MDQRQRLLAANARMERSTKTLEESRRLAEETGMLVPSQRGGALQLNALRETVGIGADTLSTLQSQREQILRTRNLVDEADSNVDKASRILSSMGRRCAAFQVTKRMLT